MHFVGWKCHGLGSIGDWYNKFNMSDRVTELIITLATAFHAYIAVCEGVSCVFTYEAISNQIR